MLWRGLHGGGHLLIDSDCLQTNSAYMLFYERCQPSAVDKVPEEVGDPKKKFNFELSKELEQVWSFVVKLFDLLKLCKPFDCKIKV